jgi:hypothetical protein
MKHCKWFQAGAMSALAIAITGCDPGGPGASGEVRLGSGVEPSNFKTLELRASPDPDKSFDPAKPDFPASSEWSLPGEDLTKITFPHAYELGAGIGTTSHRDWRLFAWLSAGDATDVPKSGEPFGTTLFGIAECGSVIDDYCGVTAEVHVTINQTAP